LFYALGRKVAGEGTRRGGSLAVQQSLRRFDVLEEGWRQVDGSGLSRDNAVAARAISGLVEASLSADPRASAAFSQSLAEPGEGTLERRMGSLEGKLRAKTGFINGTSALSGTVEAADGRVLVFSILVQYPPQGGLNTEVWKPMQDAICKELARART
jgi:D-alanyl-D-alanine carboxypeptidase/D-alanyl-D-alanine-endopeptidase (penicillin-binding protein 4)